MGKLSLERGVARGNQTIWNKTAAIVKTLPYDYVVISWFRDNSRVAGTGSVSLHAAGNALDIRRKGYRLEGSSPCGGTQLDPESMKALDVLHKALGNRFDENLWRTCTGGNHYDHNHNGDDDPSSVNVRGLASVGSGGAGPTQEGGLLQKIAGYGMVAIIIIIGLVLVALFVAFKVLKG